MYSLNDTGLCLYVCMQDGDGTPERVICMANSTNPDYCKS
jgi:hypothetical protein